MIVPVNEDYLFEVDVGKRQISPVYWEGPVFEVRRATWFMQMDGVWLPCEEALGNQIEQGYQKHQPYNQVDQISTTVVHKEETVELDLGDQDKEETSKLVMTEELQQTTVMQEVVEEDEKREVLVEPYVGQYVVYKGSSQALLLQDESTTSTTKGFFTRFTVKSDIKISLMRGYDQVLKKEENEKKKQEEKEATKESDALNTDRKTEGQREVQQSRSIEEEEEEKKMTQQAAEDYENEESEEEVRNIDQLVFVIHGIGQQMSERLTGQNFVHDVNLLRKTIKTAWPSIASTNATKNGIQVLPVLWRKNILFGVEEEDVAEKKGESDIGIASDNMMDEGGCPTLEEITLDGAPNIRSLVSDVFLDIPLYMTSKYHDLMIQIVTKEINRVYRLFIKRNPHFIKNNGQITIVAHSLGSLLGFDILCAQPFHDTTTQTTCSLDFPVKNYFALGSPLGMILLLRGNKIVSRRSLKPDATAHTSDLVYPAADNIYNIFHKSDPVAYRLEPLIVRHYGAQLKPEPIPYIKGGLKRVLDVGNELANKAGAMLESFKMDIFHKSTMLMRGLSFGGFSAATAQHEVLMVEKRSETDPDLVRSRRAAKGAATLKSLNESGRVDWYLQEGVLENAYLSALSVHMSYWQDVDVAGFLIRELYKHRQEATKVVYV
ncbi:MAG: DDHD domain-containing protein [Benjaminiella poitrasii]|nr:MAG: DDHD domain-containing protein [Benjaminiella poitrasii]